MTSKGRARSREWDMRSNMNTGQFSQGTLFSGGERSGRGYRGYTPERMAEVQRAVTATGPNPRQASWDRTGGIRTGEIAIAQRRVHEAIARSTVNLADLPPKGLEVRTFASNEKRPKGMAFNVPASYQHFGAANSGKGLIRMEENLPTSHLIHEVGHAVSDTAGLEHYPSETDEQSGREEAFADDYSMKHHRTRKGALQTGRDYGHRGKEFNDSYLVSRQEHGPKELRMLAGVAANTRGKNQSLPGLENAGGFDPRRGHEHGLVRPYFNKAEQGVARGNAADRRAWRKNG